MGTLFDLEIARERRDELLHEAEERRIAGALRRAYRGVEESRRGVPVGLEDVGGGLAEEPTVAVALYRTLRR
jgi:hypothetical protein